MDKPDASKERRPLPEYLEDGVRRALARLKVPRREEVSALSARLEKISKRIEALERSPKVRS